MESIFQHFTRDVISKVRQKVKTPNAYNKNGNCCEIKLFIYYCLFIYLHIEINKFRIYLLKLPAPHEYKLINVD